MQQECKSHAREILGEIKNLCTRQTLYNTSEKAIGIHLLQSDRIKRRLRIYKKVNAEEILCLPFLFLTIQRFRMLSFFPWAKTAEENNK